MNTSTMKKAFVRGIPAAILAWFSYGVLTSLFDDTVFEQMFEANGILFAVIMVFLGVGYFYHSLCKKEKCEEA